MDRISQNEVQWLLGYGISDGAGSSVLYVAINEQIILETSHRVKCLTCVFRIRCDDRDLGTNSGWIGIWESAPAANSALRFRLVDVVGVLPLIQFT